MATVSASPQQAGLETLAEKLIEGVGANLGLLLGRDDLSLHDPEVSAFDRATVPEPIQGACVVRPAQTEVGEMRLVFTPAAVQVVAGADSEELTAEVVGAADEIAGMFYEAVAGIFHGEFEAHWPVEPGETAASDQGPLAAEADDELSVWVGVRIHLTAGAVEGEAWLLLAQSIPPPAGDAEAPLQALIFDSWFDNYQGVIILVRLFNGTLRSGDKIKLMAGGGVYEALEVGVFTPKRTKTDSLSAGAVGYIIAGIKRIQDTKIGDTITHAAKPAIELLPGYKEVKAMVFCGLYPTDTEQYEDLRDAMEKLQLNDSSFSYEPETSAALGFGFRCGFLGLLHLEIIKERLEREFNLSLISTAPTVVYRVNKTNGEVVLIDSPAKMPQQQYVEALEEPYVRATIFLPSQYVGPILELCQAKRGTQVDLGYLGPERMKIVYDFPLNEILWDFFDRLKSASRGYASLDYEPIGYKVAKLVKLDILLNGEPVDALSMIVHRDNAYPRGRQVVEKLRSVIPRQLYEVVIQAAIGGKIIARESISAMRKNVTAKCYGGDISRKRKLIEKQKEGKKRMKQVGRVEVPQEAFMTVLKVD